MFQRVLEKVWRRRTVFKLWVAKSSWEWCHPSSRPDWTLFGSSRTWWEPVSALCTSPWRMSCAAKYDTDGKTNAVKTWCIWGVVFYHILMLSACRCSQRRWDWRRAGTVTSLWPQTEMVTTMVRRPALAKQDPYMTTFCRVSVFSCLPAHKVYINCIFIQCGIY